MPKKDRFLVRLRRWAAWSCLIPGSACALVGLGFVVWTAVFLMRATETSGQIVSLIPASSTDDGSTNYAPVFAFTASDGHAYTITSMTASNPPEFRVGDRVQVLYSPYNPRHAHVKSPVQLWLAPMICIPLGLFYALLGGVFLYFDRRYRGRLNSPISPEET
jgi:Protein of unknown function (DUF3592)